MRKREIEKIKKYGNLNANKLSLPYKRYEREPIRCEFNKDGCLIALSHKRLNQKYHRIVRDGRGWLLHRWIFYINNNYLPEVVMHTCDNTDCINPMHLIAGTRELNELDKIKKGRSAKGERNGTAKLTKKKVSEIIDLINKGNSCCSIAKKYKMSSSNINHIKNKKLWGHLNKNINQSKYITKGEKKSNSKLKEKDVIKIKKLLLKNISSRDIAKQFNVSKSLIQCIKEGRAWKYLNGK